MVNVSCGGALYKLFVQKDLADQPHKVWVNTPTFYCCHRSQTIGETADGRTVQKRYRIDNLAAQGIRWA
jgi:hypothetical protein